MKTFINNIFKDRVDLILFMAIIALTIKHYNPLNVIFILYMFGTMIRLSAKSKVIYDLIFKPNSEDVLLIKETAFKNSYKTTRTIFAIIVDVVFWLAVVGVLIAYVII